MKVDGSMALRPWLIKRSYRESNHVRNPSIVRGVLSFVLALFVTSGMAATVVVYGASGNIGSRIVSEALNRGHDVIGVTRNPASMTVDHVNFTARAGDVTDVESMLEIVAGADVVVIAVNGTGAGNLPQNNVMNRAAQTFIAAARRLGSRAPRVIHLGSGMTLYRDGVRVLDTLALTEGERMHGVYYGQLEALEHYRAAPADLQWTVISPPPGRGLHPGERTGVFRVGEDEVVVDENGEATISWEDLAVLFVNEIESPLATRKRITLGY